MLVEVIDRGLGEVQEVPPERFAQGDAWPLWKTVVWGPTTPE